MPKLKVADKKVGSPQNATNLEESEVAEDDMDELDERDAQKDGSVNRIKKKKKQVSIKKKAKKPYQRFVYSEDTLMEAIEQVRSGKLSFNKSSILYKVPKSTLYNKIMQKTPLERKMGPTPFLSAHEENMFEEWIINQTYLGFPVHPDDVRYSVQTFLKKHKRKNPFNDDKPGRKWFLLFLQRHPEISEMNTEAITKAQAPATEDNLRQWYHDLKIFLHKKNSVDIFDDEQRILCCDDIGFYTCPNSGLLLGPTKPNNFYEIGSSIEKESIFVLCTFSADGYDLPAAIIYPYEKTPTSVTNSIPDDWAFGKTDTGCPTSDSYYEYITNVLFPWLKKKNIKFPIILFMDGHKSRISFQLSSFCLENQIFLYCLPPNATLIVQPCDIIFKPLKSTWNDVCLLSKNGIQVDIVNFSSLFYNAFKTAINSNLIKTAFRVCGIFPFDDNALDYSKCINLASQKRREEILNRPKYRKTIKNIDLLKTKMVIEKIIGDDKTKSFYNNSFKHVDTSLYSIWQRCSIKQTKDEDDDYYVVVVTDETTEKQDNSHSDQKTELSSNEKEKILNCLNNVLKPNRTPFFINDT